MNKLNLYSLKLKLDRHKIKYSVSEDEKTVTIGGAEISISDWLLALLPIAIGILTFLLFVVGVLPFTRFIGFLFFGLPISFGFYRFGTIYWRKKSNRNLITFSKNKIRLTVNTLEMNYDFSEVKSITYQINDVSDDMQEILKGNLYLVLKDNTKQIILGITEKERKLIINDLEYFRDFFLDFITLDNNAIKKN